MAISAADLKLRPSERMVDDYSPVPGTGGGGRMGTGVISGSGTNDVFTGVTVQDRTSGATHLRKVWLAPMSNENALLSNGGVALTARPGDANARMGVFPAVGDELISAALTRLRTPVLQLGATTYPASFTSGSNVAVVSGSHPLQVGDIVVIGSPTPALTADLSQSLRNVTAVSGQNVTFSGAASLSTFTGSLGRAERSTATTGFCAPALTTGAMSSGNTTVAVDRMLERFDQATSTYGLLGEHHLFFPGDTVLVQHPSTATTRELRVVQRANYQTGELTFTSGVSTSYPTGTRITRIVPCGNVRAVLSLNVFSQQTWQRLWADTPTGAITAQYNGAITLINAGAITDRWAVVFNSTTAFDLVSERLGQIASGTTAADFSPLNPATNQPYFTLPAAGWGTGWLPGNCIRFNTQAAGSPVWVSRCIIAGSASSGAVNAQYTLTGDADA